MIAEKDLIFVSLSPYQIPIAKGDVEEKKKNDQKG